jgi:hypothetical protein
MEEESRGTVRPVWIGTKVHLTLPDEGTAVTLCGQPLGRDPAYGLAFRHNDCARCRSRAKAIGRVCAGCEQPLILPDAPGRCRSCTLKQQSE